MLSFQKAVMVTEPWPQGRKVNALNTEEELLLRGLCSTQPRYPPRMDSLRFPGMQAPGPAAPRRPALAVRLLTNSKNTKVNTGTKT